MQSFATARKRKRDSIPLRTEQEDSSERTTPLLDYCTRRRPEAWLANRSSVALLRILLHRLANRRSLPNQHKHQILRRKMFLDHLLRHIRRHRVDARLQLIDVVVAQPVKLVARNNPRQLPRSLNVGRKLPLDVTLSRLQLFVRHTVLVQLLQHLQRQVNRRRGRLILREAENPERSRRSPRVKERRRSVGVAGLHAQRLVQLRRKSPTENRVHHANRHAIRVIARNPYIPKCKIRLRRVVLVHQQQPLAFHRRGSRNRRSRNRARRPSTEYVLQLLPHLRAVELPRHRQQRIPRRVICFVKLYNRVALDALQ